MSHLLPSLFHHHVYVIVPPKYDSNRRIKIDNIIWEFLKRKKSVRTGDAVKQVTNTYRFS